MCDARAAWACLLVLAAPAVPASGILRAVADITGCDDPAILGKASLFEQITGEGIKEVAIQIEVSGLSDGKHAVHIHETGACRPCSAAGGHHDPGPFGHPDPDTSSDATPADDINHPFHMGDLVNVDVRGGKGYMKHVTSRITLSPGRLTIFDADGSALVIHADEDTYCDQPEELKPGCAGGAPAACGVIRLLKE
jgi:superoxide dismutase, Cu-Zn family